MGGGATGSGLAAVARGVRERPPVTVAVARGNHEASAARAPGTPVLELSAGCSRLRRPPVAPARIAPAPSPRSFAGVPLRPFGSLSADAAIATSLMTLGKRLLLYSARD